MPTTLSSKRSSITSPTNSNPLLYYTARSDSIETLTDSTSNDFYTITEDPDDLDEINEKTITQTSNTAFDQHTQSPIDRILRASKTFSANFRRHSLSSLLLSRFKKSSTLSISRGDSIDIQPCACQEDFVDGNCLKSFTEMSVQPAEYRNTSSLVTSTPIIGKDIDHGLFNVARIKKRELQDLSPKVTELNGKCCSVFERSLHLKINR